MHKTSRSDLKIKVKKYNLHQNLEPVTEEIKRPTISSKRYKSKKIHHSLTFLLLLKKKKRKQPKKHFSPQRGRGRNSKYQTQRKEEVSPLHRNG